MNEEEESDVPAAANFFSKRAKFLPKVSAEEFEATSKLLDEMKKDNCPSEKNVELPSVKKKSKRKVLAKKKCVKPIEIIVENEGNTEVTPITNEACLSVAAKRRIKKLQERQEMELKNIEAKNQKVLSALNSSGINEAEEVDAGDYDKINVLTISYLSDISRLTCLENERFSTIFPKVADIFHLKASEFLLCLGERNIKVDDTPKNLEITNTDILECIPYKADSTTQIESDDDQLKLFFQTSNSKKKIEIFVHKLEKMQDVMEKYSKSENIPLNQISFEFDGEQITGTETPEDMDMESGNCIDVTVLTSKKETNTCSQNPGKGNNASENVITVESDSNDSVIAHSERPRRNIAPQNVITVETDSNDSVIAHSERPRRNIASQNVITVETDSSDTVNTRSMRPRKRKNASKKVLTVEINSNDSSSARSRKPRKKNNAPDNVVTVGSDSNDSIMLCD